MSIRRHTLLLFFLCGWLPAVGLACAIFAVGKSVQRTSSEAAVRSESERTARQLRAALIAREQQVALLAQSAALVDYINSNRPHPSAPPTSVPADLLKTFDQFTGGDLRAAYVFGVDRQPLLAGDRDPGAQTPLVLSPTRSALNIVLDGSLWDGAAPGKAVAKLMRNGIARYFVAIPAGSYTAALVVDVSLESLLREELGVKATQSDSTRSILVDGQGRLLNELPPHVRYQPIETAFPDLKRITPAVTSGSGGVTEIYDRGNAHLIGYAPVGTLDLSYVVMQDAARARLPWWGFLIALVLVTIPFLAFVRWHQKAQRREAIAIRKFANRAADVAAGKLTQPIEVDASAELQELAGNFNLMIERLREQIGREAEARQFQSFLRLSATITHDLKNAIQSLSLLVGNLEAHFDDPEFRAHAVQGLTRSTETLTGLIARLSEPMRSLSGEMPRPQPTDLVPMLRQLIRATAEQDSRHQVNLELPDKLIVEVDAERVEKVFENLLINALQAMDKAAGTLSITAVSDAKNCTISITDTGVGMTEEYLKEKLFRAFATTKPLGIGLGLYTCREVIRAHGGSIQAESVKGSGTTFRVMLPLRAQGFWTTLN